MKTLNTFLKDESGVGGAELALLTILGLGLIALVVNKLTSGGNKTAGDINQTLINVGTQVAPVQNQNGIQ